jgi:acetoin utilization deacetylase AcuC-like enzyme
MNEKKINSAFILDFDLHVGDGNINILSEYNDIDIFNPDGATNVEYIDQIQQKFNLMKEKSYDIFAVSAGFDQGIHDWGKLLTPANYTKIGNMCKKFSKQNCNDRRFAILEGGYNHDEIGINMLAFCKGFE